MTASWPYINFIDPFKSQESILWINLHCNEVSSFCYAIEKEVKKKVLNLSSKKASDIPPKALKAYIDIYLKDLTVLINHCLENRVFSDELKLPDLPRFQKR